VKTDGATLEVLRSHFSAISSSMGQVIERASFTTFVKESADFATALASPDGEFYSYPKTIGVTIFMGLTLKEAIARCSSIEPGDVFITNDPYSTGGLATHLPDVHMFKPIFAGGELISFAWCFVHCSDVGGMVAASISPKAEDIHQEGLRIPPVKLYRRGELQEDVKALLDANSRVPELNYGDFNAMVAALQTAEQRMLALVERHGKERIRQAIDDLLEQGDLRARQVIRQVPDGIYSFEDYIDDDMSSDEPVPIRLAVDIEVKGDRMIFDFSRCDPQVRTAYNLVTNGTKHSFLLQAYINFIISSDPFIPVNGGMLRPIEVNMEQGSIVHPQYPASVGIRHNVTMRLYNVVLGALAQAVPRLIPAAGAGQAAIVVYSSVDGRTGRRKMNVVEPLGGGGGARFGEDGIDGIDHAAGFLKNTPIESLEQHADLLVEAYQCVPGTGGAGQFRGGHAIELKFRSLGSQALVTARGMDRLRFQPWGYAGGEAGQPGRVTLEKTDGTTADIGKIHVLHLSEGDVLHIRTPGGGGWGHPFERDPRDVLRDVANGWLGEEDALRLYGVVVEQRDEDWEADEEQTAEYRSRLRSERPDWDFGPGREEYETLWPRPLRDLLLELLRDVPAVQRHDWKLKMHEERRKLDGPADEGFLRQLWEKVRGSR